MATECIIVGDRAVTVISFKSVAAAFVAVVEREKDSQSQAAVGSPTCGQ